MPSGDWCQTRRDRLTPAGWNVYIHLSRRWLLEFAESRKKEKSFFFLDSHQLHIFSCFSDVQSLSLSEFTTFIYCNYGWCFNRQPECDQSLIDFVVVQQDWFCSSLIVDWFCSSSIVDWICSSSINLNQSQRKLKTFQPFQCHPFFLSCQVSILPLRWITSVSHFKVTLPSFQLFSIPFMWRFVGDLKPRGWFNGKMSGLRGYLKKKFFFLVEIMRKSWWTER